MADKIILISVVVLINVTQFFHVYPYAHFLFFVILIAAIVRRSWDTLACILVNAAMIAYGFIAPPHLNGIPVIPIIIPFIVSALVLASFPKTRSYLSWIAKGNFDKITWFLVFVTSASSVAALMVWASWTNNLGVGALLLKSIPHSSKLVVFGLFLPLFALLNALAEEVVYRGLIQESLERVFKSYWAVVLQAFAFAAVHYRYGFPNGKVGYVMVFVYGSMLGYLRRRSKGILAPYIAHVVADATIGALLFSLVKF